MFLELLSPELFGQRLSSLIIICQVPLPVVGTVECGGPRQGAIGSVELIMRRVMTGAMSAIGVGAMRAMENRIGQLESRKAGKKGGVSWAHNLCSMPLRLKKPSS